MGYLPDSGGYYMLWFRTADHRFVRDWCHRDRLLDKAVEEFATTSGRPPVEPECEFVQIIVEMFATHRSLVSAEEPAFQQRRHTMNSWHQTPRAISSCLGERSLGEHIPWIPLDRIQASHPCERYYQARQPPPQRGADTLPTRRLCGASECVQYPRHPLPQQ